MGRIARLAMAVCVALLASALFASCGGSSSPGKPDSRLAPRAGGHWEKVRGRALGGHGFQDMVPVAVDDRILIVAGVDYDQESVKTVIVDPESGRATGARPSGLQVRFDPSVVAADNRVILWGGCCGGGRGSDAPGAIYDPAADRWSPLGPGAAGNRYGHSAVWTGEEMIVWGGFQGGAHPEKLLADGAAYDPRSDTWRTIARSPLSPREAHAAVWTGAEMIVLGGSRPRPLGARLFADGAAYDPKRDRWRRLAKLPAIFAPGTGDDDQAHLQAVWTGDAVAVWNGGRGAFYTPATDDWETIPPPPVKIGAQFAGPSAVWTGKELVVWGGAGAREHTWVNEGAVYYPEANRWSALPTAPIDGRSGHAAIWAGGGMLVWGGYGGQYYGKDGAIYFPD
jgi:N-acetylneuraminic acid mutarotase